MPRHAPLATAVAALCAVVVTARGQEVPPLVPWPARVAVRSGAWTPPDTIRLSVSPRTPEMRRLGELAATIMREGTGRPVEVVSAAAQLVVQRSSRDTSAEGYHLEVAADGIVLRAGTDAGLFLGLQTLRQLVDAGRTPAAGSASRQVTALSIDDAPRFPWRGLHLDVARHFMPVEYIKRQLDLMARYKFNRFHWHLTDDQGWRLEIRRYPRLTSVGSCRTETILEKHFTPFVGDGVPHCGFYTQEQVREVVAYARARHITIIPEIEMPGHSVAAIASYPWLSCLDKTVPVATSWGVEANIFCPSERTFTFIANVLREVAGLFPGPWVHIGGDEAPKSPWKQSALAQRVMARERLKDEEQLQSYFIRRVERILLSLRRRLIGWDEILEGGLAPEATVMSWRGMSGGIAAAREGHDVIMTPTSHLYFDYLQDEPRYEPLGIGGHVPLERVYAFEPVPEELTPEQGRHILGAQANLWTEYIETPRHAEYMYWPRALAVAEVTWSPKGARDWDAFAARLPAQLTTLSRLGVNYRVPSVDGLVGDRLTLGDSVSVTLRSLLSGARIRYTLDGSDPGPDAREALGPLSFAVTERGTTVTARVVAPDGRVSPPRAATFTRTTYRASDAIEGSALQPGLTATFSPAAVKSARVVDTLTGTRTTVVDMVALPASERAETFTWRLGGYLRVPDDGLYTFTLTSDDGALLRIGDRVVIDHDGLHAADVKSGMIALRAGLHPILVSYFQGGGGAALHLEVGREGSSSHVIPASWYFHRGS